MIAHQVRLKAFIYSLMPGNSHVNDVVQNTNAILWQKREQFDTGTNFTAWAFRIARYQVMHQLGRDRRDGRLVFSDDLLETIADPSLETDDQDRLLSALDGCMKKLNERQRSLIRARYTPGHSLEEHAKTIGSSPGALRIALHRVRDLLKTCIEDRLASES